MVIECEVCMVNKCICKACKIAIETNGKLDEEEYHYNTEMLNQNSEPSEEAYAALEATQKEFDTELAKQAL